MLLGHKCSYCVVFLCNLNFEKAGSNRHKTAPAFFHVLTLRALHFSLPNRAVTIVQFATGSDIPEWVFFNDGAEITQNVNSPIPGIVLGGHRLGGMNYEGTFYIDDSDDDMAGAVFSYVDNTHFYLLSWKKQDQSMFGGYAEVSKIKAD